MLTIIMPFYKKFAEFEFALMQGNLQTFNAIEPLELLIAIDDPCEADILLSYIEQLVQARKIHFSIKLLLNEQEHAWRCPSAAINVGIRHARHEKILVISPETIPLAHSIKTLSQNTDEHHFALGIIKFIKIKQMNFFDPEEVFLNTPGTMLPYGSICFTKSQASHVGGYDETYLEWGGDDDDFRTRLQAAGFLRTQTLAKLMHCQLVDRTVNQAANLSGQKTQQKILEKIQAIESKASFIANSGHFGESFNKVIFDFVQEYAQPELG